MTPTDESDLALDTLLKMRADAATELDEGLVRACYAIQKRHQFDEAGQRGASVQAMDRLIEEALSASDGDA